MNNELLMDAISCLDSDLLAEHLKRKEELSRKTKRSLMPVILKWSAIAASLVLTVTSVFLISEQLFKAPPDDLPISTDQPTDNNATLPIVTDKPTEDNTSRPTESDTPITVVVPQEGLVGVDDDIIIDNKVYAFDSALSNEATAENVGAFLGALSSRAELIDGKAAFEYVPDDSGESMVIVPYDDKFYVYEFVNYDIADMEGNYPAKLLEKAVDIDIVRWKGINKYYSEPADVEGLIKFLTDLTENTKYDSETMNNYRKKYLGPKKEDCYFVVKLNDNTNFSYHYMEAQGIICIYDYEGYVLTKEQIEEINLLIKGE